MILFLSLSKKICLISYFVFGDEYGLVSVFSMKALCFGASQLRRVSKFLGVAPVIVRIFIVGVFDV